jgi:carbamoyltransferase
LKKLLIGIHLGIHDLNISLYDGDNFKYLHEERFSQIKNSSIDFQKKHEFIKHWIKSQGYDYTNIDAIACTIGERYEQSSFTKDEKTLWEKKQIFKDIECYQLDHHYAHGLSSFPITDTNNFFVSDELGDWHKYISIIKNEKLVNYLKEGTNADSFGHLLKELTIRFELGDWKAVGKLMALVGFGKINTNYLEKYNQYSLENNYECSHHRDFITFCHENNIFENFYDFNNCSNYICSIHKLYEDKYIKYLRKNFSEDEYFSYSGGIAQSIVLNTEFKKIFKNITILPHANDSGLSLGCIEWLRLKKEYPPININNFPFIQADEHPGEISTETIKQTAELLAKGKIVLWYQGNGEIGPRALGNRSILMNPLYDKEILNEKVKKREWYRPYGASVTEDNYKDYFELDWLSPYMLYNSKVKDKDKFKAITHVDGTCRIQTVSDQQEHYYSLLKEFEKLTGFPILLNTSFNMQGKPIVGTRKQAKIMFDKSQADVLVIGDKLYTK